jgi:hypothetical protein
MVYEDISEMMKSIFDYVKEYPGREIVSDDVPSDILFGFTLKDVDPFLLNRPTWRISCKNFRLSVSKLPEKTRDIMVDYFELSYKRQLFASLLTKVYLKPLELETT